ncbi:hypothetical protein MIR68_002979 [Amoeboaphelidium protococcarum]|nr:hypothetical protein MIR68_002979 [Amoeboaphelidium protococcarum]
MQYRHTSDPATAQMYSCVSCNLKFADAVTQKSHYQSDFHRYNLKRKVAGLPIVSAAEYNARLIAVQQQQKLDTEQKMSGQAWHCQVCKKHFSSENAHNSHMVSRKHLDMMKRQNAADQQSEQAAHNNEVVDEQDASEVMDGSVKALMESEMLQLLKADSFRGKSYHQKVIGATSEDQIQALLDDKVKEALKLDVDHFCLFCCHYSESLDENLLHMEHKHSFYVPNRAQLRDVFEQSTGLRSLLQFLADMITERNMCLYCQTSGKTFWTIESVRNHMASAGHCKISTDDIDFVDEIAQFYDFGQDEEEEGEDGWEDVDDRDSLSVVSDNNAMAVDQASDNSLLIVKGERQHQQLSKVDNCDEYDYGDVDEDAAEWKLPSGKSIGHRSLMRYYKQRFHDTDGGSRRSGRHDQDSSSGQLVRTEEWFKERRKMQKDVVRAKKYQHDKVDLRFAVRSFKLVKHFRPQVDF